MSLCIYASLSVADLQCCNKTGPSIFTCEHCDRLKPMQFHPQDQSTGSHASLGGFRLPWGTSLSLQGCALLFGTDIGDQSLRDSTGYRLPVGIEQNLRPGYSHFIFNASSPSNPNRSCQPRAPFRSFLLFGLHPEGLPRLRPPALEANLLSTRSLSKDRIQRGLKGSCLHRSLPI